MDSFEFNKIAGALLGSALILFGLNTLGDSLFHVSRPQQTAITIEGVEDASAAGTETAAEEAAEAVPFATLLAGASVEKGQAAAKACAACHTFDKGGANRVGPNLYGIVGAELGHIGSYSYSDAVKARAGETWTIDNLNAFLLNPKGFLPGTKMTYAGVKRDPQRADLVAYLNSLSDDPQPLPTE